jgi:hypothetical protein
MFRIACTQFTPTLTKLRGFCTKRSPDKTLYLQNRLGHTMLTTYCVPLVIVEFASEINFFRKIKAK